MPKSSSERSSKSEFSDSEFVFGGVKFNGGIDMGAERWMGIWGRRWSGGGEGDLGDCGEGGDGHLKSGEGDMGVVETVMWKVVEREICGWDLCLFCQERRVLGESGGGIGIAGEPGHLGEGDLGGGDV